MLCKSSGMGPFPIGLLAIAVTCLGFVFEGKLGLNLADEGYLWYGAQRVLAGELPIRDFMAYDPFRYYWVAAFMKVFGSDSILVQRIAIAALQAVGIWLVLALVALNRIKTSIVWLALVASLAWIWFIPRHKMIDITAGCVSVYVLANLFEVRTRRAYFITGLWLGFLVFVGRNHCLYATLGWMALQCGMGWQGFVLAAPRQAFKAFSSGVLSGLLPMVAMFLFYPGFWGGYLDSIFHIFQAKATNLFLPVMWPWNFRVEWLDSPALMRLAIVHLILSLLGATGGFMLVRLLANPWTTQSLTAPVAACASLVLPYAHFAYSRADLGHLAQGIFPFLILALLFLGNWRYRVPTAAVILAISTWITLPLHPGGARFGREPLTSTTLASTTLLLPSSTHQTVAYIRDIHCKLHTPGGTLYVAPTWPCVYSLLGVKAPVWDLYPLWKRSEEFELAEIARLESAQVDYLLIDMAPIDGNLALLLEHTHPLMWKWFTSRFHERKALQFGSVHVWVRMDIGGSSRM